MVDEKNNQNEKNVQKLIVVIEKEPDEPGFRTSRILSQKDVMDWINQRKKWEDFPEYIEHKEIEKVSEKSKKKKETNAVVTYPVINND